MPEIERRHFLPKKERKLFFKDVSRILGIDVERTLGPKPQVEVLETSKHKIFLVNGLPVLARSEDDVFPTLAFKDPVSALPKIVVDMGAVPYICNGADVMAPGISEIQDDFKKNGLVVILDERNKKPIALARSFHDSKIVKNLEKGKVLRNLHYVGDDIWNVTRVS